MSLTDIVKATNGKRMCASLRIFGTDTECSLYSEDSRVFIRTDNLTGSEQLVLMNEDYEEISVGIDSIQSFVTKGDVYFINCGSYGVKIQ